MVDVEEARDKLSGGWPAAAAAAAVAHRPLTLDLVHEAQLKKCIYFRYGGTILPFYEMKLDDRLPRIS